MLLFYRYPPQVTSDWDETTATWDNIVYNDKDISSQVNTVEQERLGGTMYTVSNPLCAQAYEL